MKEFKIAYTCYITPKSNYFDAFEDLEEIYKRTRIIRKTKTITAENKQHAIKKLKRKYYCCVEINYIEEVIRHEELEHAF